jgi:dihydroneopterin aldolase
MDKIIITDLIANGIIGVGEAEREFPQELILNIEIQYSMEKAGKSDSINDAINYATIAKLVRRIVRESNFHLLEGLASAIADEIFAESPAEAVTLKIEKANFISKTARVGVQITRPREA